MMNGTPVVRFRSDVPEADDLKDWVIVRDQAGDTWLGKAGDAAPYGMQLSPAYAIVGGWQIQGSPKGPNIQRPRLVLPVEFLASAREVFVTPASVVRLAQLDDEDKKAVLGGVRAAEDIRKQLAGARAGIQVVREMPTPARS